MSSVNNNLLSSSSQKEDEQLILRCRKDDSMAAFGLLVEKYQNRLFNTIYRMVGNYDDALEITQEAFCKALRSLSRFRGGSVFYTWLFRIAMNLCFDHKSKQHKLRIAESYDNEMTDNQASTLFDMVESRERQPQDNVMNRESYQRVIKSINELDPQDRAIIVLREIENLDYKHISKVLEIPVGTVKSRLARVRFKLREKLL